MSTQTATIDATAQLLLVSGLVLSALVGLLLDGVSGLTVFTGAFALAFLVDLRAVRRSCGGTPSR